MTLSFRLDFLRAGRWLDPHAFHLTNVLIHVAATLAAYVACCVLIGKRRSGLAFLAALLFALHPVHSECVSNVTSRSDALAAVFQLLAVALHASGRGVESPEIVRGAAAKTIPSSLAACLRAGCVPSLNSLPRFIAIVACLAAALLCKETSLVVPLLFVALDCINAVGRSLARSDASTDSNVSSKGVVGIVRGCLQELLASGAAVRSVIYICVAAGSYYYRITVMAKGYDLSSFANAIHNPFTELKDPLARWLSIPYVQAFALSKLLLPYWLQHEHHAMAMVYSWRDARSLFTVAIFGFYGMCALIALRLIVATMRGRDQATVALIAANDTSTAANGSESSIGSGTANGAGGGGQPPQEWKKPEGSRKATPIASGPGRPAVDGANEDGAARAADAVSSSCLILYSLAFVAITYAPSSHLLVYVAFTVAERTLFLPSFGACLLMAELIGLLAGSRRLRGSSSLSSLQPVQKIQAVDSPKAAVVKTIEKAQGAPPSAVSSSSSAYSLNARPATAATLTVCLLSYYCARTWSRTADWLSEEALLYSSLQAYPHHNGMSVYGLGAIALYEATAKAAKGEWSADRVQARVAQAEAWLKQACNWTTLAEPHVLLSQLYWRHGYRGDKAAGMRLAEAEIAYLDNTTSPRKEGLTNLGLLMYSRSHQLAPWQVARSEYLILAAHVAHGYPPRHASIALLANNAGCIRTLSHPGRYGHSGLAEEAFAESMQLQEQLAGLAYDAATGDVRVSPAGGTGVVTVPVVYRNAAVMYAVYGEAGSALATIDRGLAVLRHGLRASSPASASSYFSEHIHGLITARAAIVTHVPTIDRWARLEAKAIGASVGSEPDMQDAAGGDKPGAVDTPIGGTVADRRMAVLGLECGMELLWW